MHPEARDHSLMGADLRSVLACLDLAHLAALVDRGELRPPVDRTFPLDQVVEAHRYAETSVRGKVVLAVGTGE